MTRNQTYESFLKYLDEIMKNCDTTDFPNKIDLLKFAFDEESSFYLLRKDLSKESIQKYYKANKIMFEMVWFDTILEKLFGVNVYQ